MNYILFSTQILVLLVITILMYQIYRKFKSMPEDEIIGAERSKYITQRLRLIVVCAAIEIVLLIATTVLRMLEII